MVPNYYVVLFKNKVRKKIIKKFANFKNAKDFYEKRIKECSDIVFDKTFENGKVATYEIALLQNRKDHNSEIYLKDELGRNIKVEMQDEEFEFLRINKYRIEEKIFDVQKSQKITLDKLISTYLKGDGVKMISTLNNKFVIQVDESIKLFSLKSEEECQRFIDILSKHFYSIGRKDCLFVKDVSTPQKKYLFNVLEEMGIDKKILYRKYTTFPRQ